MENKFEVYRKFEQLRNLLYKRADKIEEEADSLRQEINQLEYRMREMFALIKD